MVRVVSIDRRLVILVNIEWESQDSNLGTNACLHRLISISQCCKVGRLNRSGQDRGALGGPGKHEYMKLEFGMQYVDEGVYAVVGECRWGLGCV